MITALPVERKRGISELVRLSTTLELLHRKDERAKQAPTMRPCILKTIITRQKLARKTDMSIDSLQRHVATLTEAAECNISSQG